MFRGYFLKKAFNVLVKLDGADGFSINDVIELVKQADKFTDLAGMEKANQVIKWVMEKWNANSGWIIQTVVQLAYVYARLKGIIKR